MFSDRVAAALIGLLVAFTGAFGAVFIYAYINPQRTQEVAVGGTVEVGTQAQSNESSAAAPGYVGSGVTALQGAAPGVTSSGRSVGKPSNVATSQSASGVTGGTITIGGIFDMTGPVDASVERDTIRANLSELNANGGILGRQVIYKDCDGAYDSAQTHTCSEELVAQHVLAIVGITAPKGENDEIKFFQQEGIPSIGGLGTPEEYKYSLSYPVSPSFAFSGNGLADEFVLNQDCSVNPGGCHAFRHPAVLYINDVPWVQPVLQAILDALHKKGIQETHVEPANSTDGDYTNHVANLKFQRDAGPCADPSNTDSNACPDTLIAATDPFSYARLFQAMDRVGWHPWLVGGGLDKGNQQSAYRDQLGCGSCAAGGQARYAVSLTPFASPYDPNNCTWSAGNFSGPCSNATVKAYYGLVNKYYPNQFLALDVYTQIAWSAAQVFVQAATIASRAPGGLTRSTLLDAVNSIQGFNTGWSVALSYRAGASHDPNHCYYMIKHDPKTFDDGGTWHQYTGLKCY